MSEQAEKKCPINFHLCSLLELNSGAFYMARKMGWLRFGNSNMWYFNPELVQKSDNLGMGLCCVDRINY